MKRQIGPRLCGGSGNGSVKLGAGLLTLVLLGLLGGCTAGTSAPPSPSVDHRVLGITANARPVPPPNQQDVLNAADLVSNAGARGTVLTFSWSQLETSPGTFNFPDLQNSVSYSSSRGFTVYLGIELINTVAKQTPTDLLGIAWDNPQLESRFHALIDEIRPLITPEVRYLSIGNEVDVYLDAHPAEWAAYQRFYENALAYVHQTMPGIQVGVTMTFTGASGPATTNAIQLNNMSDVWILTYYPLGPGFVPNGPQSPISDFRTMRTLAGTRPIVLQEVGYPTSSILSSSDSEHVTNVFEAWQSNSDQIPFLNYFALHDFTPSFCSSLAQYYGDPNDPAFAAYLCTLGLRNDDGTPKAAWQTLIDRAAAQGFPH
jgi:hypothetical protein